MKEHDLNMKFQRSRGDPGKRVEFVLTSPLHKRFLRHFPQVFKHTEMGEPRGIKLHGQVERRPEDFASRDFSLREFTKNCGAHGELAGKIGIKIDLILGIAGKQQKRFN